MLNFIGLGSAFNTKIGNTSAFIKKGDSMILIDCGGTVFHRMNELNLLHQVKNLYILITHTHPDHIGSLGEVIFYAYYVLNIKPKIYYPDKEIMMNLFSCIGVELKMIELIANVENKTDDSELGQVSFQFLAVPHLDTVSSYGIILEMDNQKIYYSGDSNDIPQVILDKLTKGEIDYFYQDTCGLNYDGNAHLSLEKLEMIIEIQYRSRVYCIHHDEVLNVEQVKELGFQVPELYRTEEVIK